MHRWRKYEQTAFILVRNQNRIIPCPKRAVSKCKFVTNWDPFFDKLQSMDSANERSISEVRLSVVISYLYTSTYVLRSNIPKTFLKSFEVTYILTVQNDPENVHEILSTILIISFVCRPVDLRVLFDGVLPELNRRRVEANVVHMDRSVMPTKTLLIATFRFSSSSCPLTRSSSNRDWKWCNFGGLRWNGPKHCSYNAVGENNTFVTADKLAGPRARVVVVGGGGGGCATTP